MSDQNSKYRNITISGLPGCGSTTLLNSLRAELQSDNPLEGWKGFSGGEFMRQYAAENGLLDESSGQHHDATVYGDDFDRQVDMGMRKKLFAEKHWILESWLSGFMAQGVPGVLKVLMICSNDAIRVDRIVNRDEVDVEEAKQNLVSRYQKNLNKWQRMYAKEWHDWVVKPGTVSEKDEIDFWRPDLYDLVIDTYSLNKEESLQAVLDAIKKE